MLAGFDLGELRAPALLRRAPAGERTVAPCDLAALRSPDSLRLRNSARSVERAIEVLVLKSEQHKQMTDFKCSFADVGRATLY